MKLKDILAISGKSGLYKYISQGRNGIIVESFDDKKRLAIPASTKVSALDDIAIFTANEEVPLVDVFKILYKKEDGKQTIDHKSSNEQLIALFETILPEYDRERVYISDMKKLVQWYNILLSLNLIDLVEEVEEEKTKDKIEEPKDQKDQKDKKNKGGAAAKKQIKQSAANKPKQPAKKGGNIKAGG
jgi:hypothetical protein